MKPRSKRSLDARKWNRDLSPLNLDSARLHQDYGLMHA
jgi:hypothetical protein